MNQKTNLTRLNELINPETFAFERGSDYGKGKPASSTEITTKKMTDTLDQMVRAAPSGAAGFATARSSYLGEDALTKKKKDHDVMERDNEDTEFDTRIQKTIRTFASVLNDLEPEERKSAMAKLHTLVK